MKNTYQFGEANKYLPKISSVELRAQGPMAKDIRGNFEVKSKGTKSRQKAVVLPASSQLCDIRQALSGLSDLQE